MAEKQSGWLKYIIQGGPPETGIPKRILAEIRERENASERLISWVQLCIVVFFSLLYVIAPRAEGSAGFNFVPLALAVYFGFTLVRLYLSYRFELPGWFLIISIGVDMALLVGLIFSFHIQYNQHPAFYLKTPTLMYVFIFIGLRALRFDPRFVLISGGVAVLGWLGLVAYAMFADMGGMHITRNYVEYLTQNSILIGAELDKTVVIVTVTILMAVALFRGRELLFLSIREHAAVIELKRFFAPEVAASITDAESQLKAGEGRVRDAAIVFIDVRGFTRVAEVLPPEKVMAVLSAYQKTALAVIQGHGGRIDKFMGDGILATFGAIHPSETYAADALSAAFLTVQALKHQEEHIQALGWPGRFEVGSAIAAGPVTAGVVGASDRLEFTVIGDAVNRAAKLENANKQENSSILTDTATYQLAVQQGYNGPVGERREQRMVAGLREPLDLQVLGTR